ncbi:MAG: TatD family hydrolase [Bacteroidia bacterium]|nr:TatD family hydrolase [Bacteroidia bacterium]
MTLIDTHIHLFLKQFDNDRDDVVKRAVGCNVGAMLLPNINSSTIEPMLNLSNKYPAYCYPALGLHPTSVKKNFSDELYIIEQELEKHKFYAIGEIGFDLYWDKTFIHEQIKAFIEQIKLAEKFHLPVIVHVRNAFKEVFDALKNVDFQIYNGVFHCFSGNLEQASKVIEMGFKIGIGGVVTYPNSGLQKVVKETDLNNIVLETDAPYLAPVPFRGKRNEASYLPYIAESIALLKKLSTEEVAFTTTKTAMEIFNIMVTDFNYLTPAR